MDEKKILLRDTELFAWNWQARKRAKRQAGFSTTGFPSSNTLTLIETPKEREWVHGISKTH